MLKLSEKGLDYKLARYWVAINFFGLFLNLLVPEKLKTSIFEIPISQQLLNINNLRTTSVRSLNLHTIRKLIEYSFQNMVKEMVAYTFFNILLTECRSIFWPAEEGTESERAKFLVKNQKYIYIYIFSQCSNFLKSEWLTSLRGFAWFLILFGFV